MKRKKTERQKLIWSIIFAVVFLVVWTQFHQQGESNTPVNVPTTEVEAVSFTEVAQTDGSDAEVTYLAGDIPDVLAQVAPFSGESAYAVLNGNNPYFETEGLEPVSYEDYPGLDQLKRCVTVSAIIGQDLMPTEKRGEIGSVKPTGWHSLKFDFVDGHYLYNRCHLIGYQLTAENANVHNLITGTRYLNVTGMLPFENLVADYIRETGNHVAYRVTPVFYGDELVARGVLMEAWSIEDEGDGVCFNVFCYNNQPGVKIDYATGDAVEE